MDVVEHLYIGGEWVRSEGASTLEVVDSTSEEPLASVPNGTAGDVDHAVRAAVEAWTDWAGRAPDERGKLLAAVADLIDERTDQLAATISREVGMPIGLSKAIQVGLAKGVFADMAGRADEVTWEEEIGNSLVVREPVGVVGAITPWNYPLYQIRARKWLPRWRRAAPSCSNPARWHRSTPSPWPKSFTRWECPRGCSIW